MAVLHYEIIDTCHSIHSILMGTSILLILLINRVVIWVCILILQQLALLMQRILLVLIELLLIEGRYFFIVFGIFVDVEQLVLQINIVLGDFRTRFGFRLWFWKLFF